MPPGEPDGCAGGGPPSTPPTSPPASARSGPSAWMARGGPGSPPSDRSGPSASAPLSPRPSRNKMSAHGSRHSARGVPPLALAEACLLDAAARAAGAGEARASADAAARWPAVTGGVGQRAAGKDQRFAALLAQLQEAHDGEVAALRAQAVRPWADRGPQGLDGARTGAAGRAPREGGAGAPAPPFGPHSDCLATPENFEDARVAVALDDELWSAVPRWSPREAIGQQTTALEGIASALARVEALLRPPGKADGNVPKGSTPSQPFSEVDDANGKEESPSTQGMLNVEESITPHQTASFRSSFKLQSRAINQNRWFLLFTASMIVLNTIFLGIEANEVMTSPDQAIPDNTAYQIINAVFALVFLAELTIRWSSEGRRFLSPRNSEFSWNCFDTIIIAATTVEEVTRQLSGETDIITLGFLRLSRLLRLSRMMRSFKVIRQFKELRIMINGIMNCSRPLAWSFVLLFCLTYMTAVFISQFLSDYLRSLQGAIPEEDDTISYIRTYFPDLFWTMYTLYECLTGGRDWGDIADPFWNIHWMLVLCLCIYIVLGVFCLLNLLTAVFLEAAHRLDDLQDKVYEKMDWMKEVKEFFFQAAKEVDPLNPEGVGQITRHNFIKLAKCQKNEKILEEYGVDLSFTDASRLGDVFDIMDEDGNGALDVDEFVQCLYHLKGPARALDLKLDSVKATKRLSLLQHDVQATRTMSNSTYLQDEV